MREIKSIDELNIPKTHKKFIIKYLKNISAFDCIHKVFLFGSCGRESATSKSDVDLFVVTKEEIPEKLEFQIIGDCVPFSEAEYVPNDILLQSNSKYNKYKNEFGMIQKIIELEGVDLSGFLSASN